MEEEAREEEVAPCDRLLRCLSCGEPGARLRRCTGEALCGPCKSLPAYRLVSASQLRRLGDERLLRLARGLPVATLPNPKNPRWAPIRLYKWTALQQALEAEDEWGVRQEEQPPLLPRERSAERCEEPEEPEGQEEPNASEAQHASPQSGRGEGRPGDAESDLAKEAI